MFTVYGGLHQYPSSMTVRFVLTEVADVSPQQSKTRAQQLLRSATVPEQSGPKSGGTAVPLSVGEPGPNVTQCRLGRGLPPCQLPSGIQIHPAVWPQ